MMMTLKVYSDHNDKISHALNTIDQMLPEIITRFIYFVTDLSCAGWCGRSF